MNKYRILIYREGCENPIVLSETTEESKINLSNKLEKLFQSPRICQLNCTSSTYIGRPSKIDGIEIFQEGEDYLDSDIKMDGDATDASDVIVDEDVMDGTIINTGEVILDEDCIDNSLTISTEEIFGEMKDETINITINAPDKDGV